MLASRRNQGLLDLAAAARADRDIVEALTDYLQRAQGEEGAKWQALRAQLSGTPTGAEFINRFEALLRDHADVSYKGERLKSRPDVFLHAIHELAQARGESSKRPAVAHASGNRREILERRLLDAVGPDRAEEATAVLALGRLSWRLRDDDNLLVGRLESQLLRALSVAAARLKARGRLEDYERLHDKASLILAEALIDPPGQPLNLEAAADASPSDSPRLLGKPRQLTGQPAAPGIATGTACRIRSADDLLRFREGQVLICDAIQPNMTHVVPLAGAVVERRGGMLIHGAIIARELGIPCVNGVANAVERVDDGESVTVDGYLGIVTVGPPEFLLEHAFAQTASDDPPAAGSDSP